MEWAMEAGQDSDDGLRRILGLSPDCDPTVLQLTAEEGFLLSRIDGHTPWRLLRQIGGMDAEEADLCLEGWLATGLVKVEGLARESEKKRPPARGARSRAAASAGAASSLRKPAESSSGPREIDESLLDPSLDIDVEMQRQILTFQMGLDRPYHELLAVDHDADERRIKRAYFKLSKEFHPDRYFRKNIGGYADRLSIIFKRVSEGYEILSDPELRAEMIKSSMEVPQASPSPASTGCDAASQEAPLEARTLSKLERLRQRMPFKIPQHLVDDRRQKALEFFKAAQQSERMGQVAEAASSVRIAICFDPYNAEYKSALVELSAKSAELKAVKLLEEIEGSAGMNDTELQQVLKLLEEVLLYRPHDPALNNRAAEVALQLRDLKRGLEYANIALEHCPEVAAYHTTLGLIHREQADIGHARKEFELAVQLDGGETRAVKGLASLRLGRRAAAQGG